MSASGTEARANPYRGEAEVDLGDNGRIVLRPSFDALVAAESELGPLFELVERAADGRLALQEIVTLFWHCRTARADWPAKAAFGEALLAAGLVKLTPALRQLTGQILLGR